MPWHQAVQFLCLPYALTELEQLCTHREIVSRASSAPERAVKITARATRSAPQKRFCLWNNVQIGISFRNFFFLNFLFLFFFSPLFHIPPQRGISGEHPAASRDGRGSARDGRQRRRHEPKPETGAAEGDLLSQIKRRGKIDTTQDMDNCCHRLGGLKLQPHFVYPKAYTFYLYTPLLLCTKSWIWQMQLFPAGTWVGFAAEKINLIVENLCLQLLGVSIFWGQNRSFQIHNALKQIRVRSEMVIGLKWNIGIFLVSEL